MNRHRHGRARGFTLLEYLLMSSLLTVTSGVLLEFVTRSMEFQALSQAQGDLRTSGYVVMDAMVTELRHATRAAAGSPPNLAIPAPPDNTQLTCYLPADLDGNGLIISAAGALEWDALNPVQYQYDAAARRLLRLAGGTTRVLANDVVGAVFADQTMDASLNPDEVRIQLTLQRTTPRGQPVSVTSSAVVKLRN